MQRLLVILAIGLFGILPACASVANYVPFTKDDQHVRQPFNTVEIPKGMTKVGGGYMSTGPDGQTIGHACYEGYMDPATLHYEMDRSMHANGWIAVSGAGMKQHFAAVYQQGQLQAIVTIRTLTAGLALDVWVAPLLKPNQPMPLPHVPNPEKEHTLVDTPEQNSSITTTPLPQNSTLQEKEL